MNPLQIPDYYTDDTLSDQEKLEKDWEIIGFQFER